MTIVLRRRALLLALHLLYIGALALPLPAAAMQILDGADHTEIRAEISATGVNRIALMGDRIAKVVRAPVGFAVEHDADSGDLYLRPAGPRAKIPASEADPHAPVTLFIGTEKGFTYRLTLTPADRDSAQILIRNAGAAAAAADTPAAAADPHIAALVRLVRAVARREPVPGYEIHAGLAPRFGGRDRLPPIRAGLSIAGLTLIETWRGPRFRALVLEADPLPAASARRDDAWPGLRSGLGGLAGTIGELLGAGRVVALWLAAPGIGPSGGRLAVAVTEVTGEPR